MKDRDILGARNLRFGCICVCVWCVCMLVAFAFAFCAFGLRLRFAFCLRFEQCIAVFSFAFWSRFETGLQFWLRFGLRFETLRLSFALLRFGSAAK